MPNHVKNRITGPGAKDSKRTSQQNGAHPMTPTYAEAQEKWKTAQQAKEWPEGFNIIVEETWHPKEEEFKDGDNRTLFYSKKSNENIDRAERNGPEFTFRYMLESDLYGEPPAVEAPGQPGGSDGVSEAIRNAINELSGANGHLKSDEEKIFNTLAYLRAALSSETPSEVNRLRAEGISNMTTPPSVCSAEEPNEPKIGMIMFDSEYSRVVVFDDEDGSLFSHDKAAEIAATLSKRLAEHDAAVKLVAEYNRDMLAAMRRTNELEYLLSRIRQWDHLDSAGDGPYWKGEIDKALGAASASVPKAEEPTNRKGK